MTEARWRRAAAAWCVTLMIVVSLLGVAVTTRLLVANDRAIQDLSQRPQGAALDTVMFVISFLGSLEVTVSLALILTLMATRSGRLFWVPLAIFVGANLLEYLGKHVVDQPLVPASLARGPHFGITVATGFSFPSGHMTRAAMIYGWLALVAFVRWPQLGWFVGAIALIWLIGYTRIYLGDHWPTDVAGGILLGGAGLSLALTAAPRAVLLRPREVNVDGAGSDT